MIEKKRSIRIYSGPLQRYSASSLGATPRYGVKFSKVQSDSESRQESAETEQRQPIKLASKGELHEYNKLEDLYVRKKGAGSASQGSQDHTTKLLRNMLRRLETRGEAFYKLGFRSYQKKSSKLNFLEDFFKLSLSQIKGTLSLGQLWTNKNMMKYLKANSMYLNRKQLLLELELLEKEQEKQRKKAMALERGSFALGQSSNLLTNKKPNVLQRRRMANFQQPKRDQNLVGRPTRTVNASPKHQTSDSQLEFEDKENGTEFRRLANKKLAEFQQGLARLKQPSPDMNRCYSVKGLEQSINHLSNLHKKYNSKINMIF